MRNQCLQPFRRELSTKSIIVERRNQEWVIFTDHVTGFFAITERVDILWKIINEADWVIDTGKYKLIEILFIVFLKIFGSWLNGARNWV